MWQDSGLVSAEIFTPHHRYAGHAATRGNRLADFLNDPTTEVLELRDVRVSQPSNSEACENSCSQLMLKKNAIVLAIPTGTYEAPARRIYGYVEKQHYLAHVMVPGYYMVGTIHMPARPNLWSLVNDGGTTPSFVPITNVSIRCSTPNVPPVEARVAIFRRQIIEALFLREPPTSNNALQQAVAELKDLRVADLMRQHDGEPSADDLLAGKPAVEGHVESCDTLLHA